MKTFDIYFRDLNEEAQKAFLEFESIESAEDGNYDCFPIATIESYDADDFNGDGTIKSGTEEVESEDLPDTVQVPVEILLAEPSDPEEDLVAEAIDLAADTYGFCIKGCDYSLEDGVITLTDIEWDVEV